MNTQSTRDSGLANPYQVLNVPTDASPAAIQAAYRYHTEHSQTDPAIIHAVTAARNTLLDPFARAVFDTTQVWEPPTRTGQPDRRTQPRLAPERRSPFSSICTPLPPIPPQSLLHATKLSPTDTQLKPRYRAASLPTALAAGICTALWYLALTTNQVARFVPTAVRNSAIPTALAHQATPIHLSAVILAFTAGLLIQYVGRRLVHPAAFRHALMAFTATGLLALPYLAWTPAGQVVLACTAVVFLISFAISFHRFGRHWYIDR